LSCSCCPSCLLFHPLLLLAFSLSPSHFLPMGEDLSIGLLDPGKLPGLTQSSEGSGVKEADTHTVPRIHPAEGEVCAQPCPSVADQSVLCRLLRPPVPGLPREGPERVLRERDLSGWREWHRRVRVRAGLPRDGLRDLCRGQVRHPLRPRCVVICGNRAPEPQSPGSWEPTCDYHCEL
jgi:hypothetical protein